MQPIVVQLIQMSILEISTAVSPTLTLMWNYLQVNLQFHKKWIVPIHPSSMKSGRSRTDHKIQTCSPLLMLKLRERPFRRTNPRVS